MNARLRIMVDSREVEESYAPDREVATRWHRAVGTYGDAGKDLGLDSRLTLYYQAGLQAATALVRAGRFRVLGTDHQGRSVGRMLELGHAWLAANRPMLNAGLGPLPGT